MKLDQLFKTKKTVFSFEVFPPKKSMPLDSIYPTLAALTPLTPDFISVTYGAGGGTQGESTVKIAADIKGRYSLEALAHLTCLHATREDVLKTLDQLEALGVTAVLALRGDKNPDLPQKNQFTFASELIELIAKRGGFHIAAACYPEGHPETGTIGADIENLLRKQAAGAHHLITQLFFKNEDFYRYRDRVEAAGVHLPIEAGIMPVVNRRQVERMVSLCGTSIPRPLSRIISQYGESETAMLDAGIAYAVEQIVDLAANGVRGIHLYTMNNPTVARRISESVRNVLDYQNS